ncbi:sensor histidine kinase [Microlunatus soli]|uniref:histidine kinase n=1 Tax=Microlunatus soli TaxID=630515 RepID=A0A1H1RJ37_9ACTN|nr:histidine kinase [Microlunatus soli]SDS35663.1 Signal transduction histidine kinase [Microlunatus soli]
MERDRLKLLLPFALATVSAVASKLILGDIAVVQLIGGWLIQVVATVLMIGWRRSWAPMVVLVAATAAIAFAPIGWQQAFAVGLTIWIPCMATYGTARLVSGVRSRIEIGIGAAAVVGWIVIMVSPAPVTLLGVLAAAAPPLSGACAALVVRLRAARRDRIAWLAKERELQADRRAAVEREQIAADLHDLVTHQMVRIVFQARNLADHAADQPTSAAADEIAGTATLALTQMRDFLRSTRSTEPEPTDDTGVSGAELHRQIASIVTDERAVGHPVSLGSTVATDDLRLSSTAAGCLIRGVHEGVVNAAKHAPESTVMISSSADGGQYLITIENSLPTGSPPALAVTGSGTGLRGLTRRAALIGGAIDVHRGEGSFRLRIRVPVLEPAPAVGVAGPDLR